MTAQDKIKEVLASHGMDATDTEEISFDIIEALGLKEVWGYRRDSHIDYIDHEVGLKGWAMVNLSMRGGVLIRREVPPWEEVGEWVEPDEDEGPDEPSVTMVKRVFEEKIRDAKVEAIHSTTVAYNKECLKFQAGWGSNELDVAKLAMLGKTLTWLGKRQEKYTEPLPRTINLKDSYGDLSDGAKIEVDGKEYSHRIGFGDFVSSDHETIIARDADYQVTLVDNNL